MKYISVIGSGTMGNGIAHVFAQYGFQVSLIDISESSLKQALSTITSNLERQVKKGTLTESEKQSTLSNIQVFTSLQDGVKRADLVVEAATENQEIKFQIFRNIDSFAPSHCILATNTSSISISSIASVTQRPAQVIGMHFMNPVPIMKLVEVINGKETSAEVTRKIVELSKAIEKIPVEVKDYPGFAVNRILIPMINESIQTLRQGVAGVEEIDTVMKIGLSHPMGPLQLADFIGLDVCLFILNVLYDGFKDPKYIPCPLLVEMVAAGNKGVKTGEGFYKYTPGSKELVVAERFRK